MTLLHKLRFVGERIDDMYRKIDPEQHKFLVDLRDKLIEKHASYRMFSTLDPTIFHGRSLIYNRSTPVHRDSRDPKANLTPIVTVGSYVWGRLSLPDLGLVMSYNPGTLVMLRGSLLAHGVEYGGGQRISIAHFLHNSMLRDVQAGPPPLTAAKAPGARGASASASTSASTSTDTLNQ